MMALAMLETPEPSLVVGMKWFQGTYTQRYNSRHGLFGHLYQGRYKALVVDGTHGNYLGVASTYIHLNPARAGLVRIGEEALARYPWSSRPLYVKESAPRPGWLVTERVLGSHGLGPKDRSGYRRNEVSRPAPPQDRPRYLPNTLFGGRWAVRA